MSSGNFLAMQVHDKKITSQSYKEQVELLFVEEFDFKEEALDREEFLIQEYKDRYGELCCNKAKGNRHGYGNPNQVVSKEERKRRSDWSKAHPESYAGFLKANRKRRIPIYQIDLKTNEILNTYSSTSEAMKATGICSIGDCLSGKTKQAGGFIWRKAEKKEGKGKGTKWFNNGVVSVMSKECPEGFVKGRIFKR